MLNSYKKNLWHYTHLLIKWTDRFLCIVRLQLGYFDHRPLDQLAYSIKVIIKIFHDIGNAFVNVSDKKENN